MAAYASIHHHRFIFRVLGTSETQSLDWMVNRPLPPLLIRRLLMWPPRTPPFAALETLPLPLFLSHHRRLTRTLRYSRETIPRLPLLLRHPEEALTHGASRNSTAQRPRAKCLPRHPTPNLWMVQMHEGSFSNPTQPLLSFHRTSMLILLHAPSLRRRPTLLHLLQKIGRPDLEKQTDLGSPLISTFLRHLHIQVRKADPSHCPTATTVKNVNYHLVS